MLKGITITLHNKKIASADEFNRPIYQEAPILVENVLVAPESNPEILSQLNLSGKKEVYVLAIPKGIQIIGRILRSSFLEKYGVQ